MLKDFSLPETPFRGLIVQGDFCLCAYIGVPEGHWLADMESLHFDCHWRVTFNGVGGDGVRPAGWYWYGWDYAHAGDQIRIPDELQALLAEQGLVLPFGRGKTWTLEEVECDVIDVAVSLGQALLAAEQMADRVVALAPKPR